MDPNTYAGAGVNIERAEAFVSRLKKTSARPAHKVLWKGAGGYASVVPISDDQAVALTTDGVGTKLLVACELRRLETIGIDLVAMVANDLICVGAKPAAFLDYYAVSKLDDQDADALIKGIVEGCDRAGMLLVGGETAEMPDLYADKHFDIAGFAMGTVSKSELITGDNISPGDTLIGVASSGIHSNGLSLARKVLSFAECGNWLLEPTLIYCQPVVEALSKFRQSISGMVHVTGSGWRNLLRLNANVGFSIDNPLTVPPIFERLAESVAVDEMYKTFNMGMGFALIVKDNAEEIVRIFESHNTGRDGSNFHAQIVGKVTADKGVVKVASSISERGKTGNSEKGESQCVLLS